MLRERRAAVSGMIVLRFDVAVGLHAAPAVAPILSRIHDPCLITAALPSFPAGAAARDRDGGWRDHTAAP
eukprot:3574503-Prymnesium_polylepis.1